MTELVLKYLNNFQNLLALVTCLLSLRTIGKRNIPAYMNGFFIYSWATLLQSVLFYLRPEGFQEIKNLLILFYYGYLGYFFLKITKKSKTINFFSLIYIVFFIVMGILLVSRISQFYEAQLPYAIANLGLLILCAYYYYFIFEEKSEINFINEPAFWIVTGQFCFSFLVIPLVLFEASLIKNLAFTGIRSLQLIYHSGALISNLCFIWAFILCKKKVTGLY